jgi:chromosomal replication initiator protein
MLEIDIIWQQCLVLLKDQFGEQDYNTWFKQLDAKLVNDKLQISANNRLVQDFIKNKYWDRISNVINELTGGGITAELLVHSSTTQNKKNLADTLADTLTKSPAKAKDSGKKIIDKEIQDSLQLATKLNPRYSFDSLVRGNSNQLAYAIGMHITQEPGNKNHNPLSIYGGVGLGKTHLMQAIGNTIHAKNPKAKIRYLHANEYIEDVVKASMSKSFEALKKHYNSLDLLLMDDIQFIAGDKTKTQEEFFYTFNTLLDKGKQVIMTSDTYPKNISALPERLLSRFASGLTVEIQPPELEMRVAILKQKAIKNRINLDDEVAFYIAQNIKSNVRELEGALNKVTYHGQFSGRGISLALAKEALMDILAIDNRSVSIDDIQKTVCEFYKIKVSELLSSKRTQIIARPRQIAMALAKELTQLSLPSIGNAFGGRDHSTVIHAQKTIVNLRKSDERLDRDYNLLIQMLNN